MAKTIGARNPATNPSKTFILLECAVAVGRGVESKGSKKVSPEAVKEWRKFFSQGIQDALDANFPWSLSRANALKVARHMGQIASRKATGGIITKKEAKAAAEEVKKDKACPSPGGGGRFCA